MPAMRQIKVRLTGRSPLIMHKDNITFQERVEKYNKLPKSEKSTKDKKGDDRSPAWTWIGSLYRSGNTVGIPADNLMTMLRDGGSKVPLPGGKSNETFKKITQSGILINEILWEIVTNEGQTIDPSFIDKLELEMDFDKHLIAVQNAGFNLLVKRAKIGQNKHVRVRPIFETGWSIEGELCIVDDKITDDFLEIILNQAGSYVGLCDWRPGSPKSPGSYGMFSVEMFV